ncbi:unnamed protein product [Vicia faba]|uniref:Uncharacterized protein n=1 Tax=Vicia faba TaxID=3906 RepID=A0AAV0YSI6_VICFA|nr:unnamed protein product [Vicia faba]
MIVPYNLTNVGGISCWLSCFVGIDPKMSTTSKKQKMGGSTSHQPRKFDSNQFLGAEQQERFKEFEKRKIWSEKTFNINREGTFREVAHIIELKKWGELINPPRYINYDMVREFYANSLRSEGEPFTFTTMVRGMHLIFDRDKINEILGNPLTLREGKLCKFTKHVNLC